MNLRPLIAVLALLSSGCDEGSGVDKSSVEIDASSTTSNTVLCDGVTTDHEIESYFSKIDSYLRSGSEIQPVEELYASRVLITERGSNSSVSKQDISESPPYPVARDEWVEIARAGPQAVKSGGWRGCYLGDGRVGLKADEHGKMGLSSFNRDRKTPLDG